MKKRLFNILSMGTIIMVFSVAICACGNEITMQEIIDANSTKVLLSRYDSVIIEKKHEFYDNKKTLYVDEQIKYIDNGETQEIYTDDRRYEYFSGVYSAVLEAKSRNLSQFENLTFYNESFAREEIKSMKEQDATIFFITRMTDEEAKKELELFDIKLSDGDYIEKEYIMNKRDYFVLGSKAYICTQGGGRTLYYETISETDPQKPKAAEILLKRIESEDVRTVTLVLDPDTDYERSFSSLAVKGDGVIPYPPEGYDKFYKNRECTILFDQNNDYISDLVVYSKRSSENVEAVTNLEYNMKYNPEKFSMSSAGKIDTFRYVNKTELPISVTIQRYENQDSYKLAEELAKKSEKTDLKPEEVFFGDIESASWLILEKNYIDGKNQIISTVVIGHGEDALVVETKSFGEAPQEVDILLEEMLGKFSTNKTIF